MLHAYIYLILSIKKSTQFKQRAKSYILDCKSAPTVYDLPHRLIESQLDVKIRKQRALLKYNWTLIVEKNYQI